MTAAISESATILFYLISPPTYLQYQDLVSKVKRRDAACVTGPPGSQISKGKRKNREEKEEEKQNLRQIKKRKTN